MDLFSVFFFFFGTLKVTFSLKNRHSKEKKKGKEALN